MTLFQIIPADLHSTYFFQVMQAISKKFVAKEEIRSFKYGLFMILHVETRANLVSKFNIAMRDSKEAFSNEYIPGHGGYYTINETYFRSMNSEKLSKDFSVFLKADGLECNDGD